MNRRAVWISVLLVLGVALVSSAQGGPRVAGVYRLEFDPLAADVAQGVRPGEAVSVVAPGELVLIAGEGFGPEVVVLFGDLPIKPLAQPFSNEGRLIVVVPQLHPGAVKVLVQRGKERGNELELTISQGVVGVGQESYAAFKAIEEFLFLAGQVIWASLEELPTAFQPFAAETIALLQKDRLLALQLERTLSSLSQGELRLLDGLFASVGLKQFLQSYGTSWQDGTVSAASLEGLHRTLQYKGSALKAIGELLGELTVTVWNGTDVTSAGQQELGRLFRALGELNENLGGNAAFLASLLREGVWEIRWFTLQRGVGDLALGLAALEEKLDNPDHGLAALAAKIDQLGFNLNLSLNGLSANISLLEGWLREITARLDTQLWPGLLSITARLDNPDYGLAEIKAEVAAIASQLETTFLPGMMELLRRQGVEQLISDETYGLKVLAARLDRVEAKLDNPDYGLAEIKAEVRELDAKVDKIWKCLSGMTFTYEERPAEVKRMPLDVMLAIDSSGSMITNDPRKMRILTAIQFIDQLDPQQDQVGVVSWDNDIDFIQPLTSDLNRVKDRVEQVDSSGATSLNVGLSAAIDEFVRGRPDVKRVIIFLTDGDGTYTFSGQAGSPASLARQRGIVIYAIGLGSAPVQRKLEDMATATGGKFFIAPTAEDLRRIYEEISKQLVVPAERVLKMSCPMD
ncbi:MAG: VWA domain-containing protein [Candidatus Acetothermia bacterium]|nr:VWA domain-containing protein [Candidatus Acetothermia bacterium]MDH7504917.1 VWA domain-containing protein [Candidatus Acetothermia bacterium]